MDSILGSNLVLIALDPGHATAAAVALAIFLAIFPAFCKIAVVYYTITSFFFVSTSNREYMRWIAIVGTGYFIVSILFGGIFSNKASGDKIENVYVYSASSKEISSGGLTSTSNVSVFGTTPFEVLSYSETNDELAYAENNNASLTFVSGSNATTPLYQISPSASQFPLLSGSISAINERLANSPYIGRVFIYVWNSLNTVAIAAGHIAESDNIQSSFIDEVSNIWNSGVKISNFPQSLENVYAAINRSFQNDSATYAALATEVPSQTRVTISRNTSIAEAATFYLGGLNSNQPVSLMASEITADNLANRTVPAESDATIAFQDAYVKESMLRNACLSPVSDDSDKIITADRIRLSEQNATYGSLPDADANNLFLKIFGEYDTELVQSIEDLANAAPESPFQTASSNPVGKNPTIGSLLGTFETDDVALKPCMTYAGEYYENLGLLQEQALRNIQNIDEYVDEHESVFAMSDDNSTLAIVTNISGPGMDGGITGGGDVMASLEPTTGPAGAAFRGLLKPVAAMTEFETEVLTNRAATNGTEKALEDQIVVNTTDQSTGTAITKGVGSTIVMGGGIAAAAAAGAPITAIVGLICSLAGLFPVAAIYIAYVITYALVVTTSAVSIIFIPFYALIQFGKALNAPVTKNAIGFQQGTSALKLVVLIPLIIMLEVVALAVTKGLFMEFFNHAIGMLGIMGVTLGASIIESASAVAGRDMGALLLAMTVALKPLGINIGMVSLAMIFSQVLYGHIRGVNAVSTADVQSVAMKIGDASVIRPIVKPLSTGLSNYAKMKTKTKQAAAKLAREAEYTAAKLVREEGYAARAAEKLAQREKRGIFEEGGGI